MIPWTIQAHKPNGILIGSAIFAQTTAQSSYTLQWDAPSSPENCPFHGGSGSHLIQASLSQPKSSTQTAFGWFSHFCRAQYCDRQTMLLGL